MASSGIIGFVGLLVPHLVCGTCGRIALSSSCRSSAAALLTLSDVLARVVFAPAEISVGAITALIGAPLFLVLLRRHA